MTPLPIDLQCWAVHHFDGTMTLINPDLFLAQVREKKLPTDPDKALEKIKSLHQIIYRLKKSADDLMAMGCHFAAREVANTIDPVDAQLQKAWGFPMDYERRTHWCGLKECTCSSLPSRTVDVHCPFHGLFPKFPRKPVKNAVIPQSVKDLCLPNPTTLAAIQEAKSHDLPTLRSLNQLMEDLHKD